LDWNIGGVLVKSITAHQDWSDEFQNPADGTSIGLFDRIRTADSETFTQELNVSGSTGRVDWIAGLYYMDEERSSRLFFDFPIPALFPLPVPIQIDAQEPQYDTESKSAFIDVTWSVTDDFRLGAGKIKWKATPLSSALSFPTAQCPFSRLVEPTYLSKSGTNLRTQSGVQWNTI
jgi:iron complex outermembrane receptor protein